jgi:hypothetical protein
LKSWSPIGVRNPLHAICSSITPAEYMSKRSGLLNCHHHISTKNNNTLCFKTLCVFLLHS